MAAVSTSLLHVPETRVKLHEHSDEEPFDHCHNSNSREASNSPYHDGDPQKPDHTTPHENRLQSSFSMQNVLKMKTERDSVSPDDNVFSTDKLLQNTPTYDISSKHQDFTEPESPNLRNDSRSSIPTPSPRFEHMGSPEGTDLPLYSNPNSVRVDINVDEDISCCSEDTVLSVGNDAPLSSFNTPSDASSPKSVSASPGVSPSTPNQGLTSFKHIQTHLNAISQLSQNLNMSQPLLLRPNPITPNPLLFLNQPHLLFQNPLLNQIDSLGGKHSNMSGVNQIPSRLSSTGQNPLNQTSPTSPSHSMGFTPLNQFGLRHLKQNNVLNQGTSQDSLNNLRNLRTTDENRRLNFFNPKSPSSEPNEEVRRELILNQNCLKFSIDNILKADFGRRITDPLHKRKSVKNRVPVVGMCSDGPKALTKEAIGLKAVSKPVEPARPLEPRVPDVDKPEKSGAIDLSKCDEGGSSTPSVGSSTSDGPMVWPAWVYCTRYSDRPSSGRSPRTRRPKKPPGERSPANDEKRPRTAFSGPQLARLKHEFAENRYLTERRRQSLAAELGLAEAQIKIWFQNKRAKIKKASGQRNPLALQLMAQGLYNHSTVPLTREEEELQEMQAREARDKQGR